MQSAPFPFIVALLISGHEESRSSNPSLDMARGVAAWHVEKSPHNAAQIIDRQSGKVIALIIHEDEQAIDSTTGEICECPNCSDMREQVKGIQRTNRGLILQMAQLRKDLEAEAKCTREWIVAQILFDFWRVACNHKSSQFTLERFQQVLPYLKKYDQKHLFMAIAGANYDPFETTRKNGTKKRHNGWELIFRDAAHVEEFACKCPKGFIPPAA